MYSDNILNFQESTTILNARTKIVWKLIEYTTYIYYIYTHTLKAHSISKVNLSKESATGSSVYNCNFIKGINNDESFHIQEDFHDIFYKLLCTVLFLYQRVSVFPLQTLFFLTQARSVQPMLGYLKRFFLTEICFSVHITYYSVNFTWFVLFTYQKSHDRPLFKPSARFAAILNSLKINILTRLK